MSRLIFSVLLAASMLPIAPLFAEEVVVYSARKEHLIKPLFDRYQAKTGVEVRYITDKAGPLLQRLKAEGKRTPADMLITVDAGNLWHAANEGVLASVDSAALDTAVPAHLKDPQNHWFGLSVRARTIVYNTDKVTPAELSSYEDLADEKWRGRLCLRTSKKVYNQSLVAMLISHHGADQATRIVEGWVKNLALPPFSNDTKTMEAITAGQCDVGIVNTYYFGRLQKKDPNINLALFWPNQSSTGVHVNVSGAGVTAHAPHREAAVKLLEWLASEEAQDMFAELNMEYPVNAAVPMSDIVAKWGGFKPDQTNLSQAGKLQSEAVQLMDRAGYR
ncbi:MAG: Fe(3+) ABC transporter substrate-binding protein [Chromatiales bacterium]|jgi:iron(III) transport system substrate-binding protein